MAKIVYLNKEYLPLEEAKVSVMDRGFLFSDGVYEVVPIYGAHPFLPKEHYERFQKSLEAVKIESPISYEAFLSIIQSLIERNDPKPMQSVYIQITRGVAWDRAQFVTGIVPTVFARLETVSHPVNQKNMFKVVTVEDIRWGHCDIKGINRLANILMFQTAFFGQMNEAIIMQDEQVIEGCSSNVFIVENNTVITPPLSKRLLNGVTRKMVIELAKKHYKVVEENISRARLLAADEVWITSSTREVAGVGEVDGHTIGNGTAGSVLLDLQKKYKQHIDYLVEKNLKHGK